MALSDLVRDIKAGSSGFINDLDVDLGIGVRHLDAGYNDCAPMEHKHPRAAGDVI